MQVNLTANGATDPIAWHGGPGTVTAWGNFGGGTNEKPYLKIRWKKLPPMETHNDDL